jgi:AsmA protein
MKKIWKIIGIIVVVLIVVLIALPHLIDVNKFKPKIESEVSDALGRKVEVGNISLAIFSGGVSIDDVSIADDPAFSHSPFLQAKKVSVGVALLPLIFSQKLEVSSFTVVEPQVSLLRSKSGVWNFSTMGAGGSKPKSKDTSAPTNISVEKLKISNATIVIGAAGGHGKTQTYQNVDFEASDLSYTTQFPFKFSVKTPGGGSVKLDGKAGPIDAADAALTPLDATVDVDHFDIAATGVMDPSSGVAGIVDFKGNVSSDGKLANVKGQVTANKLKLKPEGSPASVAVNVDLDTAYDLTKQSGTLKQCDVHIGKALARLTGTYDIAGETAKLNMKMNGQGMPIADLEAMLPAAGVKLPPGASLKSGSLDLNLALSGPADKMVIAGPVKLTDGKIGGFSVKSKLAAFPGMGGGGGNDTDIQLASTDLHVDPAQTQTSNIDVVLPSIGTITGNGTISAAGQLNFKMSAKLSGAMGVMSAPVSMIGGNKSNGGGIPFTISGTTSNPVIVPDVAGAAGNMAKGVAGAPTGAATEATGAIGGLFGKKKKN